MKTITIPHTLVQCTDIKVFRINGTGRRIMMMPYYVALDDGSFDFRYINELTNVAALMQMIADKKVYILEKHIHVHTEGS